MEEIDILTTLKWQTSANIIDNDYYYHKKTISPCLIWKKQKNGMAAAEMRIGCL